MDNLFLTRSLTEAVNNIKPVRTPVLDKVFGRKKFLPDSRFAWDVLDGTETIMRNLKSAAPADVRSVNGKKVVTCAGTRFSEKSLILASDIENMRAFGSQGPELLASKIAQELEDMKSKVDRTREFMACKALSGTIVDSEGETIVTFTVPSANKPTLTGVNLWTDSESQIVNNIRAWKKLIAQGIGGVDSFVAFCGSSAMDAMIENDSLRDLLKMQAGKQIADEGRIGFLAGTPIEEILGAYVDGDGNTTDLFPAEYFCLVGLSSQTASELYAPAVDLDDANGVGSGRGASMFFSKSWKIEDPSGRWIKVESRPLPVLMKPKAIVYAKVVA